MALTEFSCLSSAELSAEDIIQYHLLFKAVFGIEKPEGQFERQFLPGPVSFGFHAVMRVDGQIMGAYSAIPLSFIQEGKKILIALVVDALVHPEFQGKGYLKQILEPLYSRMKQEGYHLLYGMPNKRFYPLLTGPLGWTDLGRMKWLLMFPRIRSNLTIRQPLSVMFRPWDKNFAAYRFFQHQIIQTEAGRTWLYAHRLGHICVDFERRDPEQLSISVKALSAKIKKPVLFPVWCNLIEGGIQIPGWIQGARTMVAVKALTEEGKKIISEKRLLFTLGDFDVY